jgi:hypothetical protein
MILIADRAAERPLIDEVHAHKARDKR